MKLESGLEYKDNIIGEGDIAKSGDLVHVHYTGWAIENETDLYSDWTQKNHLKFDSSVDRGTPFEFPLGAGRVIKGWDEGVAGMKIGGKRTLIIPSHLAYGSQGAGGAIKPNANLKFDVELIEIVAPPQSELLEESIGTGDAISIGDQLKLHFRLTQLEPTEQVVQESYSMGQPIVVSYGSGQLPRFLEDVLEGMKIGGKRTSIVPAFAAEQRPKLKVEFELIDVIEPVSMWAVENAETGKTDSGLEYAVLERGTGETPKAGENVRVHYSGFLTDGTKFDSSVERGTPFEFPLGGGRVIKGWDEGVALFPVGSKVRLTIPSDLGYGDAGSGSIPPKATLLFDIEILA